VGGTDQFFNIVTAARKVMSALGAQPNIAICLSILPGTDGVEKMSKSLGNHIPINTTPEDMYGKLMSIPDSAMSVFFSLVTRWTPDEITMIEKGLADGSVHPRDAKMKLAFEVTDSLYGKEGAEKAQADFVNQFQKNLAPEEMASFSLEGSSKCLDVLMDSNMIKSRSEGRTLIEQKAVRLGGVLVKSWDEELKPGVLQVGKRKFLRLT
jgi:tyrosyl-tRNA synthetase